VNVAAVIAVFLALGAEPAPNEPIPREPARLAHTLLVTSHALDGAVDRWRREGNPARGGPPSDVELLALYHQRIYRLLRANDRLARAVFPLLPSGLAREARSIVGAGRKLRGITPALKARTIRTKRPVPLRVLLRHYRDAERRFGVRWEVLAAVNFSESAFGKIRTDSAAGAQGPMQFMPATWAAYGGGGDINDTHDAIRGAARYLAANDGARDIAHALYRYNHSNRYVVGVQVYADLIAEHPRAFLGFYYWGIWYLTDQGEVYLPVGYEQAEPIPVAEYRR
jgi:hypothetical protein